MSEPLLADSISSLGWFFVYGFLILLAFLNALILVCALIVHFIKPDEQSE